MRGLRTDQMTFDQQEKYVTHIGPLKTALNGALDSFLLRRNLILVQCFSIFL